MIKLDWITKDLLFIGILVSILLYWTRGVWISYAGLSILIASVFTYYLWNEYQKRIESIECNIKDIYNNIPSELGAFFSRHPEIGSKVLDNLEILSTDPYSLQDMTEAILLMEMNIERQDFETARLNLAQIQNSISGLIHAVSPLDFIKVDRVQEEIQKTFIKYLTDALDSYQKKTNQPLLIEKTDPRFPSGFNLKEDINSDKFAVDIEVGQSNV